MNKISKTTTQQTWLVGLIEQGYHKTAWHGPNLKASIRRVDAKQAAWRPKPSRKSIADIVIHCAYWKYVIRRRISGGLRGSFPLKGSNWFDIPAKLTDKGWKEYLKLLDDQHHALVEAVAKTPWNKIVNCFDKSEKKAVSYITGVSYHDVYHAGQIQTLKALSKK